MNKLQYKLNYLKEQRIIKKYEKYGLIYGDGCSYACIGYDPRLSFYEKKFKKWEKKYEKLGYISIPFKHFISAGGYGSEKYKEYMYKKHEGCVRNMFLSSICKYGTRSCSVKEHLPQINDGTVA